MTAARQSRAEAQVSTRRCALRSNAQATSSLQCSRELTRIHEYSHSTSLTAYSRVLTQYLLDSVVEVRLDRLDRRAAQQRRRVSDHPYEVRGMPHAARCMLHDLQRTTCNDVQRTTHNMRMFRRPTGCAATAAAVTHRWKCTVSRHGFSACAGWNRSYRTPAPHRRKSTDNHKPKSVTPAE